MRFSSPCFLILLRGFGLYAYLTVRNCVWLYAGAMAHTGFNKHDCEDKLRAPGVTILVVAAETFVRLLELRILDRTQLDKLLAGEDNLKYSKRFDILYSE